MKIWLSRKYSSKYTLISDFLIKFAPKAILNQSEMKDLNRIKVVLAEKKRTNKWLAEQMGKTLLQFQSGVQILLNQTLQLLQKLLRR